MHLNSQFFPVEDQFVSDPTYSIENCYEQSSIFDILQSEKTSNRSFGIKLLNLSNDHLRVFLSDLDEKKNVKQDFLLELDSDWQYFQLKIMQLKILEIDNEIDRENLKKLSQILLKIPNLKKLKITGISNEDSLKDFIGRLRESYYNLKIMSEDYECQFSQNAELAIICNHQIYSLIADYCQANEKQEYLESIRSQNISISNSEIQNIQPVMRMDMERNKPIAIMQFYEFSDQLATGNFDKPDIQDIPKNPDKSPNSSFESDRNMVLENLVIGSIRAKEFADKISPHRQKIMKSLKLNQLATIAEDHEFKETPQETESFQKRFEVNSKVNFDTSRFV